MFLGNRYGAGIQAEIMISETLPGRNMGMALEQNISRLQGRQLLHVIVVPVGGIDQTASCSENTIVRHNGKSKDHLIHLRIAVPADAENPLFTGI